MSVGKTTFIEAFTKELPEYTYIKEAARELIEEKNIDVNNISWRELANFQKQIVDRQTINEVFTKAPWITDTTFSDTLAYAKDAPDCEWIVDYVESYYNKKIYDVIFYIPPEIELEDDGVRHTDEEYRMLIDERIKYNLHSLAVKHPNVEIITLTGSVRERVDIALKHI